MLKKNQRRRRKEGRRRRKARVTRRRYAQSRRKRILARTVQSRRCSGCPKRLRWSASAKPGTARGRLEGSAGRDRRLRHHRRSRRHTVVRRNRQRPSSRPSSGARGRHRCRHRRRSLRPRCQGSRPRRSPAGAVAATRPRSASTPRRTTPAPTRAGRRRSRSGRSRWGDGKWPARSHRGWI